MPKPAPSDRLTIRTIETHGFRLPMRGALQWGQHSMLTELHHVAVRIVLSDDSEGWSEAPPRPTIYGETTHSIASIIRQELAPRLIGRTAWTDDTPPGSLWTNPYLQQFQTKLHEIKNNHTAKAALDMALHDALAQHRNLSLLHHLLDGQPPTRSQIAVSYILGIGELATILEEAEAVVAQGVRVLKVKVGRSWSEDISRICQLKERLGSSVRLYADANECLDPESAAAQLYELAELGLLYCEEPLPIEMISARQNLRQAGKLPLIADDSAMSLRDLQRELALDTFDILNIKTARTGFTESMAMLALARQHGKGVMVGSQASSGLGTRHAALFAALPGIGHPSELSFPLKLDRDVLAQSLPIDDGMLCVAGIDAAHLQRDRLTSVD